MPAPLSKSRIWLFWILLIFFTSMIYSPIFSVGFYDEIDWLSMSGAHIYADKSLLEINVIDDYITQPLLRGEPIRFIFTTALWWYANYKWWGTDVYFHHLMAFLLFLIAFWQLFVITKKLTDSDWSAMLATMLFALFPFNLRFIGQGYLVNYLLLVTTFFTSISLYLSTLQSRSSFLYKAFLYLVSISFFILATWSHESAYALPILLFGMDLILTKSKGKLSIIKSILRTSPYSLVLVLQIGATVYFALQLQSAEGVEHDFSGYIAYPTLYTLRFVYEGFLTPFYEGSAFRAILSLATILCYLGLLVIPFVTWRAQNKTVILVGLFWAGITLLPALPILGSPLNPPEAEDKYFFLPMSGLCIVIASLVFPKGKIKKHWQIFSLAVVSCLLVVFWVGINVNSKYFLDEGRSYELTAGGLKEAIDQSPQAKAVCLLYGESQPQRDRMLSALLQFTLGENDKRSWFYLDQAASFPMIDGRFPDLTLPKPTIEITKKTGVPGKMRGGYKKPWEFIPIQFVLDEELIVLGFDPISGKLRDLRPLLLPTLLSAEPPTMIDLFQFSEKGEEAIEETRKAEKPAEGWYVQGNVYRLFPQYGRF